MTTNLATIDALDWDAIGADLDRDGFAHTPPLLTPAACAELRHAFDDDRHYRSTIVMARHRFGRGVYRYYANPLPDPVERLRTECYPHLAQIANTWSSRLAIPGFPADLAGLAAQCAAAGQHRPTPLILRYEPGDYNCLHQDLYGDVAFPLQLAIMLSEPDEDFTGGESVFVEQRPRAQSKASVVRPGLGEGLIFAVNERPVPGSARGWRRVKQRHGVSDVRTGLRYSLGIIFHDAT